jgi:hypothetical protein
MIKVLLASGCASTVDEEFNGVGVPQHIGVVDDPWDFQRRNLDDAFTGETQPLPAGDEQHYLVRLRNELPKHAGCGDNLLEVVDD